jgi:hypothetical protein
LLHDYAGDFGRVELLDTVLTVLNYLDRTIQCKDGIKQWFWMFLRTLQYFGYIFFFYILIWISKFQRLAIFIAFGI